MSAELETEGKGWTDERTLRLRAVPQQVWEAWAEPERLKGWFPEDARGKAEPGGEIVHVWEAFGLEMPHRVIAAEPGRLLELEAVSPGGVPFRQEIHVEGDGTETVLRLVHSGDGSGWEEELQDVDSGWKMAFALLRLYLERYPDRRRRSFSLMRPARYHRDQVYRLYATDQGLSRWLGEAEGMGEAAARVVEGTSVRIALSAGGSLSGPVLAATGTEVCLGWEEIEGALELKAFAAGDAGGMIALRGHSWHPDPGRIEGARQGAEAALDRLAGLLV